MNECQWIYKSPVGPLFLTASSEGLSGLYWKKQNVPMAPSLSAKEGPTKWITAAVKQLKEYFSGQRTQFDLPLDISGTEFQKQVWRELTRIPYGETISYRELAARIKREKAFRAVGTANGRNPISIIVPCHRVIASNGSLAGFAGGLPTKEALLALELKAR